MKFTKYSRLKWFVLALAIGLCCAPESLYAAASAGAGERSADEGFIKVSTWIGGSGHNAYGKQIEVGRVAEFEVLLGRMDPAAKAFQASLAQTLSNNAEFKDAASKNSYSKRSGRWRDFLSDAGGVISNSLGIYLVYNSPDLAGIARGASYGVYGLALVDSLASLGENIWEICSERYRQPFPTDDAMQAEAVKIAYLLTFQAYPTIVARKREPEILIGEYESRVLGALSRHYPVGSRASLANTIITSIRKGP